MTGGIPGALDTGATSTTGKLRQALSLSGTTGRVDFGDVFDGAIAGVGGKFSVAMWFQVPGPFTGTGDNGAQMLWTKTSGNCPDPTDEREIALAVLDNGRLYATHATRFDNIAQFGIKATTALTVNAWHHVVFTYDQSVTTSSADQMALYLDGVLEPEVSYEYPVNTPFDPLRAIPDGPAHLVLGGIVSSVGPCTAPHLNPTLIDEYAFWGGRVLTSAEVTTLYNHNNSGNAIVP